MERRLPFAIYDAFSAGPFGGAPATAFLRHVSADLPGIAAAQHRLFTPNKYV